MRQLSGGCEATGHALPEMGLYYNIKIQCSNVTLYVRVQRKILHVYTGWTWDTVTRC